MKLVLTFTLALLTLAGCKLNEESSPTKSEPGDVRTLNPVVVDRTTDLYRDLQNVCGALEEKERDLEDYVGRERLQMSYEESDCDGKSSGKTNHEVMVYRRNGRFEFQNESNTFGLPEAETLQSGTMKEICQSLLIAGLQNPLRTGAQTVIEFRGAETSNCRNSSREVCLQIYRGRVSGPSTYVVSESTLMSISISRGERPGFFRYKRVQTFGACDGNKYRTKTVTF